jgi:hypothetical protein
MSLKSYALFSPKSQSKYWSIDLAVQICAARERNPPDYKPRLIPFSGRPDSKDTDPRVHPLPGPPSRFLQVTLKQTIQRDSDLCGKQPVGLRLRDYWEGGGQLKGRQQDYIAGKHILFVGCDYPGYQECGELRGECISVQRTSVADVSHQCAVCSTGGWGGGEGV